MASFNASVIAKERCVQIVLLPRPGEQLWDEFEAYFGEQLGKGFIYWDVDMRRLPMMNSMLLGLLVGMNAKAMGHGGQLRLIVPEKSGINQVLTLSNMRRIMQVIAT